MPSSQQDHILRLIEQLGAALRRMRELLARGVPATDVVRQCHQAQADLFGPMWPTLRTVDPATAAALVHDGRQVQLWAELLRLEAEGHRRLGDEALANTLEVRAATLLQEIGRREPP